MAHMIDYSNDRANIAYVGKVPWHGLGSKLEPGQPIERWRIAAGLDWEAREAPALFNTGSGFTVSHHEVPQRKVIYRSDTLAALGIVSDRYQLVQPAEVLEFFREYVQTGDLELETAGSLAEGRRIWALARLGLDFRLFGQDRVEGYLLLATSMDGSMATTAKFTSVRVVCQNTLSFADRDDSQPVVRVNHTMAFDADQVKAQLGLAGNAWQNFATQAEQLADVRVTEAQALEWLRVTFGEAKDKSLEDQPNQRVLKAVWHSVTQGPGADLRSARNTPWGLLHGATHYVDHVRGKTDASRLDSAWFGAGQTLKARALANALKLAA